MTLSCLPASVCSWDYCILTGDETLAILRFKSLSERGSIEHNGHELEVYKSGFMSGRWTLELNGEQLLEAKRPSMFSRSFLVTSPTEEYELVPKGFSRGYVIQRNGSKIGVIDPVHSFTRRATIDADASVPTLVQLFTFWMVAILWRRAHQAN